MKLPYNLTNAGQTAEVEGAILLIDQAAGTNLDHLQSLYLSYKLCDMVQHMHTSPSAHWSAHNDELVLCGVQGCLDTAGYTPHCSKLLCAGAHKMT